MEQIQGVWLELANKNSELAPQESKLPKSGDVVRFSDALKDKKIANVTVDNIKEALRYAMVKIGLRSQNWPSEEEKTVLINHIIKGYNGHTISEIKLAFDMAIEGKLDVEVNCYENFSCLYFSNIMSSYRQWAKQEYEQLLQEPPAIEYKEDISDRAMAEWFRDKVKDFERDPEKDVRFAPISLYTWLDEKGLIKKTAKHKHGYLTRAVYYRQEVLMTAVRNDETDHNKWVLKKFNEMKDEGCFTGGEITTLKNIAKQIILKEILLDRDFRI